MNKSILGVYDTELKARNVVEGLIVQGYRAEEIVVVAMHGELGSDFPTGTRVERIPHEQDESVVDKIKHSLLPDEVQSPEGVGNKLLMLGATDREAPMYATDVENGRILVLVNEKDSMEARTVPQSHEDKEQAGQTEISARQLD
jgi:hypothetical protein